MNIRRVPVSSLQSPVSNGGFTLLGVLFATFFVVIVVVALAALAARTTGLNRASRERFVATGLAREGLELVRHIRDSNWFTYDPALALGNVVQQMAWRGGAAGGCVTGLCSICDGPFIIDQTMTNGLVPDDPSTADDNRLFIDADGVYSHTAGPTQTIYSRTVAVATGGPGDTGGGGCGENATETGTTLPTGVTTTTGPDRVRVTSTVTWRNPQNPAVDFRIDLQEELFDWVRTRP